MDQQTTSSGSQPSALHCQALGGETCPIPTVQCQFSRPPECKHGHYPVVSLDGELPSCSHIMEKLRLLGIVTDNLIVFFLRIAATNAHDFFTAAHETLQNVVITDALKVDQLVADFAPQDSSDSNDNSILSDILKLVAPGFSMSDKVEKQRKGLVNIADSLGFIGGAISLAAGATALADQTAPPPVSISTLTTNVENQLANIFTSTNNNIAALNSNIFGGDNNIDLNQIISFVSSGTGDAPDSSLQPITQIFSTGAFMKPVDQNTLSAGITAGFQLIKQQLVASLLAAQNFFVFVDTDRTENDCNGITGSRFINGQCFTIEKRTQTHVQCTPDSQPIDASIVLKFDDPNAGYNIDLPTFYQNVQDCNNGQPAQGLDIDGDFPRCAFGIPFIKAAGSVCNAVGTPKLPASLQVGSDSCNKVVCPRPSIGGGCHC